MSPSTIRALEQACARLDEQLSSNPDDPRLLTLRGRAAERLERFEDGARFFSRAARAFRERSDGPGEASATIDAAVCHARAGDLELARRLFERAIDHLQDLQDPAHARARVTIARALIAARDLDGVEVILSPALPSLEAAEDWENLGWAQEQLGLLARRAGDADRALEWMKGAVKSASNAKDRAQVGVRLSHVASLHHELGNLLKARNYQETAQPYLQEAENHLGVLAGYELLVDVAFDLGETEPGTVEWRETLALIDQAVEFAERFGRPASSGRLRVRWGRLALNGGDAETARWQLDRAVAQLHVAGDPFRSAEAHLLLASATWRLDMTEETLRALGRAEQLYEAVGDAEAAAEVSEYRRLAAAGEWTG